MIKFTLPTKITYFKSEKLTPAQMFDKTSCWLNTIARLTGCHVLSPCFSYTNLVLMILSVDVITYYAITFQNIYELREDFVRTMLCVVTLGMGSQIIVIYYTFILDRKRIKKLFELAKSFHESANSEKASKTFERWILNSCHLGYLTASLYQACGVIVFFYPIVYYWFTGQKILHFGFVLPGFDWETPIGYSINFAHHTLQTYVVVNNILFSHLFILLCMLNGFAQFDALEILLDHLNELAINNKNEQNGEKIRKCLADITNGHAKLLE